MTRLLSTKVSDFLLGNGIGLLLGVPTIGIEILPGITATKAAVMLGIVTLLTGLFLRRMRVSRPVAGGWLSVGALLAISTTSLIWISDSDRQALGSFLDFSIGASLYLLCTLVPVRETVLRYIRRIVIVLGLMTSLVVVSPVVSVTVRGANRLPYAHPGSGRPTLVVRFLEQQWALDPNHLNLDLMVPFVAAVSSALSPMTGLRKSILFGALAGVLFLAILLSGSRAGTLAAMGAVLILLWRNPKPKRETVTIVAVVMAGVSIVGFVSLLDAVSTLAGRYDPVELLGSGGSGRLYIWQVALTAFGDSPLRGFGFGTFPMVFDRYIGDANPPVWIGFSRAAHNTFLRAAVETGLPGFLALAGLFGFYIRRSFRQSPPAAAVMVALTIMSLTLDLWTTKSFWGLLIASDIWLRGEFQSIPRSVSL